MIADTIARKRIARNVVVLLSDNLFEKSQQRFTIEIFFILNFEIFR